MPILSIIVPIYNEALFIKNSLPLILNLPLNKKIIVVNDGSNDGSKKILENLQNKYKFKLINLSNNQGKGCAIRNAFKYINSEYFTICDADSEYNPNDLIKLVYHAKNKNNSKTVIYGSRFLKNKKKSFHYFVNASLTKLTNILFKSKLTDMETCFKVVPTGALKKIKLTASRFEIEPQITAQLLKNKYQIIEIPIEYKRRKYSEGKKIKPKDGFIAVWTLFKEKISS